MRRLNKLIDEVISDLRSQQLFRKPGSDSEPLSLYTNENSIAPLARLKSDITKGKYKVRPVIRKTVGVKSSGDPRTVYALSSRDYLVSKAIVRYFAEKYPGTSPKSTQDIIRQLEDLSDNVAVNKIVSLDIKNFYDSIDSNAVVRRLNRSNIDPLIMGLLHEFRNARIWKANEEVAGSFIAPGFPHSSIIANIAMSNLERDIVKVSGTRIAGFYRYVDDILIVFSANASWITEMRVLFSIRRSLRPLGLELHPLNRPGGKGGNFRRGDSFRYLGYNISLERRGNITSSIPELAIKREKTAIWKLFNEYFGEGKLIRGSAADREARIRHVDYRMNLRSGGCRYKGLTRGFMQYYYASDDVKAFRALDRFALRLMRSYGVPVSKGVQENGYYYLAYGEFRKSGFHKLFRFNYDKFSDSDRRQHLVNFFGYSASKLSSVSEGEVQKIWFELIDREIRYLNSSPEVY